MLQSKKGIEMSIKNFIQGFTSTTKTYIEKFEQYKELSGKEKKARVDSLVTTYCVNAIDNLGLNFVLKFAFKKLIVPNIPNITQAIFDLIESKVQGITK